MKTKTRKPAIISKTELNLHKQNIEKLFALALVDVPAMKCLTKHLNKAARDRDIAHLTRITTTISAIECVGNFGSSVRMIKGIVGPY